MAKKHWIGGAPAVAQVVTGSIDTVDGTPSNDTFAVTIGNISITLVGDTDAATTAAALVAKLNLDTNHDYFTGITWDNPSAGTITATADVPGVPFETIELTVSGGTGTVTDFASTVSPAGPNDWRTAANWSDNVVPVSTDDVTIGGSTFPIVWGLDQSAVTVASLTVLGSITKALGLRWEIFANAIDGVGGSLDAVEYRQTYLKIGWDRADLGEFFGPGTPIGSNLIKLHNSKAGASLTVVHGTGNSTGDDGGPAVRLLFDNAGADLEVRSAPAGVGIGVDAPGEVVAMGDINITDSTPNTKVYVGEGVTWDNWQQSGGQNRANRATGAAIATLVKVFDGELVIDGSDFGVATITVEGGEVIDKHTRSSGSEVATVTVNGGKFDAAQTDQPRTFDAVNHNGGDYVYNDSVTATAYNLASGERTVTIV